MCHDDIKEIINLSNMKCNLVLMKRFFCAWKSLKSEINRFKCWRKRFCNGSFQSCSNDF